jgi:type II secretory pathway component PulK
MNMDMGTRRQPLPAGRSPEAERGVALILVLVVLPLVAIMMVQLEFETNISDLLARNALANQQFKQAILARIRQMRLRLVRDLKDDEKAAQEGGAYDHYGDAWGPDSEGGETAARVQKGKPDRGDEIVLYTQVVDEQSKFNLNLLLHKEPKRRERAFEVLFNLLNFFRDARFDDLGESEYDLDESEAKQVAEAIRKFLVGEQRDERVRKAELPDPAQDMRQGIYTVRDLVFSHPLFFEKRLLERFTDVTSGQTLPSLGEFVTVYGDGKINLNTALIQTLRAMFKEEAGQRDAANNLLHGRGGYLNTDQDQELRAEAQEERERAEEEGRELDEESESVYRSLNDVRKVEGLDDAMLRRNDVDLGRDFTVRSNFYGVVVTARRGNFLRQHRVVFERHNRGCITWLTEVRAADAGDIPGDELGGEASEE